MNTIKFKSTIDGSIMVGRIILKYSPKNKSSYYDFTDRYGITMTEMSKVIGYSRQWIWETWNKHRRLPGGY